MATEILNEANEATSTSLGFRFSPRDEELVMFYLKNKVLGRPHPFEVISEIDIYKKDPWELPAHSLLKNRDKVWFFFTTLDKKYAVGTYVKRSTPSGQWKVTCKERQVTHHDQVVGTKKILIFLNGRHPLGIKANWVMHEYRVCDPEVQKAGNAQTKDAYVLCKIMEKSKPGQNISPFDEVDWEDGQQMASAPQTIVLDGDTQDVEVEPPSECQALTTSGPKTHEPSSSSFEEAAANERPMKSGGESASCNESTFTSADLEQNVTPKYVEYIRMLESESRNMKTDVEALKAEAAKARSNVNALESRIHELTMEELGLRR